ncbi:MAG TPA: bidirectional hydrogenase complex protein HoxE [Deinococcales bacterium]|nr:bidirectional hydrogenase complex protein HoxE [Deinococcales bacterium]
MPATQQEDKRWRVVEATMRRHGYQSHALIETLHTVQESFGYLDEPSLRKVASALHVPLSRAYGVATFYHLFNLKPQGKHNAVVCLGTACYIKGSPGIIQALSREYDVQPGGTTADGEFSLLVARCLGSCGLAPATVFDGDVQGKLTPAEAVARVHAAIEGKVPARAGKVAASEA